MSSEFPPDEFDEIASRGGPVGVHRAPRPWWTKLVAPVVVFLIAGGIAYLIATYLWDQEIATPDEPTPTITESIEETVTPTPTPSDSPSPTPTATEPAPPPVQYDAAVAVLNGSGISGLAGDNQQKLEDAGFSDVEAANLTGDKPDANVVVYTSEELKTTAEEVATTLGIDDISLDVTQTDADVEVHLVSNPAN